MISDIEGGSEKENNSPGPGQGSVVSGRKKVVVEYICPTSHCMEMGQIAWQQAICLRTKGSGRARELRAGRGQPRKASL